jgi:predicted ArsR family transcriptional regulator
MRGSPGGGVSDLNPLAEVRQDRMAGIIWDEGFARVTDLADRFGVSAVTVRADLTALEGRARVRRVRGGAVPPSGLLGERPFESSQWESPAGHRPHRRPRGAGRDRRRRLSGGARPVTPQST